MMNRILLGLIALGLWLNLIVSNVGKAQADISPGANVELTLIERDVKTIRQIMERQDASQQEKASEERMLNHAFGPK